MPKTQEIEHFVLNWNFPLFNSLLGWEIPKFNWRLFCIYAKDLLAKILQLYIWKSSKSLIAAVVFLLFTTFLNKNLHLPNEVKIIPQNKIVDDQTSAKKKIVEANITQAQVQVNQTLKTWEFVWLRNPHGNIFFFHAKFTTDIDWPRQLTNIPFIFLQLLYLFTNLYNFFGSSKWDRHCHAHLSPVLRKKISETPAQK